VPKLEEMPYRLYNEDCFETFARLEPNSIDLVLVDPPYGTTQCKWDSVIPLERMWKELKKLATGPVVITSGQPFASVLTTSNLPWFKYQWIWVKTKITGVLNAKKMPVRKHEQVLVFGVGVINYFPQGLTPYINKPHYQGRSSINYGKRNEEPYYDQKFTNWPRDVLEIASEGATKHPTQKPVALMEYLIKTYSNEGDTVLDFAMGSGTTGVACGNLGRKFIGCDSDKEHGYFEIAKQRIKQAYTNKTIK